MTVGYGVGIRPPFSLFRGGVLKKFLVIGLVALALGAYFLSDLQRDLNLAFFQRLYAEHPGITAAIRAVRFDKLLVAVGRQANTAGLGLEDLGFEHTPQGTLVVDDYLRTIFPDVHACGDVAGPYQFTHTAAHQALVCGG